MISFVVDSLRLFCIALFKRYIKVCHRRYSTCKTAKSGSGVWQGDKEYDLGEYIIHFSLLPHCFQQPYLHTYIHGISTGSRSLRIGLSTELLTAFPAMDSDFLILQIELFRVQCFPVIHLPGPPPPSSDSYSSSIRRGRSPRFPWKSPHRGDHPFGIPPGFESSLQVAVRTMPQPKSEQCAYLHFHRQPRHRPTSRSPRMASCYQSDHTLSLRFRPPYD